MSLDSHLRSKESPVRRFLETEFPNSQQFLREYRKQLSGANTLCLANTFEPTVYSLLGTAIDYRIRFFFENIDVRSLVAYQGGMLCSGRVSSVFAGRLSYNETICDPERWISEHVVEEFFSEANKLIIEKDQSGQQLNTADECLLLRLCIVLALFEQVARGGVDINTPLLVPKPQQVTSELFSLVQDAWVDDLHMLSQAFYESTCNCTYSNVIPGPIFDGSRDIGGADADLILDHCLVEIKSFKKASLSTRLLYQLLGYSLLDYNDRYAIQEIAIYFVRQKLMLKWPLDDVLLRLSCNTRIHLVDLRHRFQTLLQSLHNEESLVNLEQPALTFPEWMNKMREHYKEQE